MTRSRRPSVDGLDPPDDYTDDPVGEALADNPNGEVLFLVRGDPAPQGSYRAIPVGNGAKLIPQSAARFAVWRNLCAVVAEDHARHLGGPLTGPLGVDLWFRFRMPASRSAKVRNIGRAWHGVRPDLDKLARAVFDAMTVARLIVDDGQIAAAYVQKEEVAEGWTGVRVHVRQLSPGPRRDL